MPAFKVFNTAKQMQESAAATAKQLSPQAPDRAGELRSKAGEGVAQLKEQVSDSLSETMNAGFSKMTGVLDDLNDALPVLQEAGYLVDLFVIELGISPKIAIRFSSKFGVKNERFNELLEEHSQHKMTAMLLNLMSRAKDLQSRVRVAGLKPKGIEIEIGIMPEVSLRFG